MHRVCLVAIALTVAAFIAAPTLIESRRDIRFPDRRPRRSAKQALASTQSTSAENRVQLLVDAAGHIDLARRSYEAKDSDHALAELNAALLIVPSDQYAFALRGGVWLDKCEVDNAILDFNRAILLAKRQARLLAAQGIREAALDCVYTARAVAWLKKGDEERAVADLNSAIRLNPQYAPAYFLRGMLWTVEREISLAADDFSKALTLGGRNVGFHGTWHDFLSARECP